MGDATVAVRLRTDSADGAYRDGESVERPRGEAFELIRAGLADGPPARVRAVRDGVLIGRRCLAAGESAECPPDRADALRAAGAVEVISGVFD